MNKATRHNLRFLIAEVVSQVANLQAFIETGSDTVALRIVDRSGYVHNLRERIHDSALEQVSRRGSDHHETLSLRAFEFISTQLERIAELCRDCVRQMSDGKRRRGLDPKALAPMLQRVVNGMELIVPAMEANDTQKALKLGQIEQRLDRFYQKFLRRSISELKDTSHPEDVISALFVAHHIEQMGDALLRIGESLISVNLGQPMNLERYQSLQDSMARLDTDDVDELEIQTIAQTRSGSSIAGISVTDGDEDGYVAVFKDGQKRKLKEEKQTVKSWHEIYPGLAPKILSYHKRGQSAALLIEHLAGLTFEQILLHEAPELLQETLDQLCDTLRSVWKGTRSKKPARARFMRQTAQRMQDVYAVHPEFERGDSVVCGHAIASFDSLLLRATKLEENLRAPFSVYIHGDFNVDNIIYDPLEKRINFIDLHRSSYMDYVQDVSVFMVSNYRLQILDAPLRRRIMLLAQAFYRFSARFARKAGDEGFEMRLALGLARSFVTSTRFILDKSLARRMYLRARYLIELVLLAEPEDRRFSIPIEEIFSG